MDWDWIKDHASKLLVSFRGPRARPLDAWEDGAVCNLVNTDSQEERREHPFLQYVVWRRLSLMVLILPVFVTTIWQLAVLKKDGGALGGDAGILDTDAYVNYDRYSQAMIAIRVLSEFICVCMAVYTGYQWKTSRVWATLAWFIGFVVAFMQFMWPLYKLFDAKNASRILYDESGWAQKGIPFDTWNQTLGAFFERYLQIGLVAAVTFKTIMTLGPASISLLPGLARGTALVSGIFPQCAWVNQMTRLTPFLFAPIAGLGILTLTQFTISFALMAAGMCYVCGLTLPTILFGTKYLCVGQDREGIKPYFRRTKHIRLFFYPSALLCLILFVSVDQKGEEYFAHVSAEQILRFVGEFLIHYRLMTIICADWLLSLLITSKHDETNRPNVSSELVKEMLSISALNDTAALASLSSSGGAGGGAGGAASYDTFGKEGEPLLVSV